MSSGEIVLSRKLILSFMAVSVLSSLSFVVSVEADSSMWSQTYGGTDNDVAHSLVATSDGGYAIAGITDSVGDVWGDYGVLLVKTDSSGNMEWNRTYGKFHSTLMEAPPVQACSCSLVATSDGGYAIAGETFNFGSGDTDAWLVKTDASGNMEWNQTYGGAGGRYAFSLVQTSDGGYAIAGYTDSFGAGYWLVKTDAFGYMEWNKTYGGTDHESARSLVATSDGGYAIVGNKFSSDSVGMDAWLVKTDAYGNMEWNQTYGGYYSEFVWSVVATSDGGYAIAGETRSYGAGSDDFWLVKTDAFGYMEWNQTYGGVRGDYAFSLVQTSDGGYAIAGLTESFGAGPYNYWLVKTDAFGYMEWNQTYGGVGFAYAFSLVQISDGGYALAGSTESFGAGGKDFWLMKTDETGYVPEYSSWLLTSILLVAISVIVVYKKKLFKKPK
jgi:hypothetical protein